MTAAEVVHVDRGPGLTLSEVPSAPRSGAGHRGTRVVQGESHHITLSGGTAVALAEAIAAHLSTRAAPAVAELDDPRAFPLRADFVVDALRKAARCPLCRLTVEGVGRG